MGLPGVLLNPRKAGGCRAPLSAAKGTGRQLTLAKIKHPNQRQHACCVPGRRLDSMKTKVATAVKFFVLIACVFLVISNTWGRAPQQDVGQVLNGRMNGGGSITTGTQAQGDYFAPPGTLLTHSFDVHCNVANEPNSLEIQVHQPNGAGGTFHMDQLVYSYCWDDPSFSPKSPAAPFDSMYGQGIGSYNGTAGFCADWAFTDQGEPGTNDRVGKLRVWNPFVAGDCSDGTFVFSSNAGHSLTSGNHQAHKD
jgi:hypothetical protein